MSPNASPGGEGRSALLAGLACYGLWGFLPLYFHLLGGMGVGPAEMIAHRTLWSVFWALGLVWLSRQTPDVRRVLGEPRTMGVLALSTLMIFINWSIYVWAVEDHRVIEASLGYYINPLLNMAVGAVLFRDRVGMAGKIAIGLAVVGVAVQALALGHLPWVSLGLGISFCAYGVLRKQVKAEAQTGLFIECLYLAIPGLLYVLVLQQRGEGHFLTGTGVSLLLLAAGPATVVPLALFSWAARRLSLTALGFLQFLAPTLQFLVGLSLGETFTPMRALSFAFIWAGVAVFAWGAWRATRRAARIA
jgi:chloramphenicol-sensitive protein RarD